MDILSLEESVTGIVKFHVNMVHLSGMVIRASVGLTVLLSM